MCLEHLFNSEVRKEQTMTQMPFLQQGLSRGEVLIAARSPVFNLFRNIDHINSNALVFYN
jgi:hypothetical protein